MSARNTDDGFTIVELIVVLFVVCILIGLAVTSMRGSRNTGGRLEVRSVATRYADAVERFQTDHGRKVPTFGAAEWPTADAKLGPKTVVALGSGSTTKYYVKQPLPEILERSGPLNAEIVGAPAGPSPEGGTIVYRRLTPYEFTMSAYWDGELLCVAGDAAPGAQAC